MLIKNNHPAVSAIQPKKPTGKGWSVADWWQIPKPLAEMGYPVVPYEHESGLFVLSAVEVANDPGQIELGPEYHISISLNGERCSSRSAKWVLKQFGLSDATEDNHVPHGKVRNYWRPVNDKLSGYECPCVDNEPAIREDKGDYIWRGQ